MRRDLNVLCSDFSDEVADLTDFTSDNLVEACVYCLRLIIPDFDSPTTLPEAMSAKFRICTGLANACQVGVASIPSHVFFL